MPPADGGRRGHGARRRPRARRLLRPGRLGLLPGLLQQHLGDFVAAYDFARRLETLKGLTPYEAIYAAWQKNRNASP